MSRIVKIVKKDPKRRGFIILTHALMLFVTIAMIGLAVDAGTMYVIKGRLSSAVDAAALAAGRSVNLANTVAGASAAATTTATQFFNANFPNGYLGTGTMNLSTPTFTQETDSNGNPTGYLDIAVNASVPAPTYFMQIFGIRNVNVSGTGTATRRGTVMILVLDISSSMGNGAGSPCAQMKTAVQQFITNFSPYDIIGVVQFDYTAKLLYPPDNNFGSGALSTLVGNITCGNNTNTTSAMWLAYEQIKSVGLPLAYNSVVLFTDGSPNGISANFPVRTQSDSRYGPNVTIGASASCGSTSTPCAAPVACTGPATQTVAGTIAQWATQADQGTTTGLYPPINTDSVSYPAACNGGLTLTLAGGNVRQLVAYIPDFDKYGNSTHGVPATSTPPNCPGATCGVATVTLKSTGTSYYYDTRDFWRFQCNDVCPGATGAAATACSTDATPGHQFEGGAWSSYPADTNSNFFTAGPYTGYMRPDQGTTIVAATMNTAMSEAYWIRQDASGCGGSGGNGTVCPTLFHPVINTIYLLGNAGDAADHEFLSIMSNTQQIIALPYDNSTWAPYTNPAFQQHQESGLYQVTASPSQLTVLFAKLADEVLRLSH
jgi:Flp pilus assembly protein TadG